MTLNDSNYRLEPDGKYRISNYDKTAPFSSFLPGIAGVEGVPLWCMYVNRGQAIASMGTSDKDHAIIEFLPATWAYQLVGIQGFRTFCKIDGFYYEPFQNSFEKTKSCPQRTMWIEPNCLQIEEKNSDLGITFNIEYFSPINQSLASLIRLITVKNISNKPKTISLLDGLALIIPAGMTDFNLKSMRRLSEAYASVRLLKNSIPFYSSKVLAHDEAEVTSIDYGHFYASWFKEQNNIIPAEPYVDPDVIFGSGNSLIKPYNFIENDFLNRNMQIWENRFPCALTPAQCTLNPEDSTTLISMVGFAPTERMLEKYISKFKNFSDINSEKAKSVNLIEEITRPALSLSSNRELDGYVRQNYLDNILRGGIPFMLPSKNGSTPLYLYSRRHGDLERDYNYFELASHPLSSGPGNYRDICQNRRHDIWFYPDIKDEDLKIFINLLQADGFNPLGITGYLWTLPQEITADQFCPSEDKNDKAEFIRIFENPFHPGQLLNWLNLHDIILENKFGWLENILSKCQRKLTAGAHDGGYWIDHWTYIVDLLEAYEAIYPDNVERMLTEKADIIWFDEGAYVVPRKDKYFIKKFGPLQLNAITDAAMNNNKIPMPPVTIFAKLCALVAIKAVSFDYTGRGLEMEAGRPGWNDSLNGLPGLFGSSTCEVIELGRLASWLLDSMKQIHDTAFPIETANLIEIVIKHLHQAEYSWHHAAQIREDYRKRVRFNISGQIKLVSGQKLEDLLACVINKIDWAIKRSVDSQSGLIHTYYRNEPALQNERSYSLTELKKGVTFEQVERFKQTPLPLFLEGQVHLLRMINDPQKAGKIYQAVKNSPLFDPELKMYKLNECLDNCPKEIGRARTFTRGWYENESVWLHMSYKYILELLKAGLYEEFFTDIRTMFVPFMNPDVYGRSILENCSFVASSVCPDPAARGRGFVARLSGSTAEFIHIWNLLTVGAKPFYMKDNKLQFKLEPVLPSEWFTKETNQINWKGKNIQIPANSFVCVLFGDTLLIYHNQSGKNTFGANLAKIVKYELDGKVYETEMLPSSIAEDIRDRKFNQIDVWLR
ncbi:MAG: hypothetical protein A2Y10_05400 [Planctomycetes bacterium GWF2_41_51]|nr:MAG: hypothetical protein A2Y10_05400 [Planctomycetes bacterium GWF2_41_51]HBG26806.1 hypothetical protein [Phycisphaerales bacterium]